MNALYTTEGVCEYGLVAPTLGQHNAEIFSRLGVSPAEVERLQERGIV